MIKKFSDILLGESLPNEQSSKEKYNVPFGLAVMASDAISSVAYAAQEILWALIGVIGLLAYQWLGWISLAIIALLIILTISYIQIIKAYPHGGGAYVVAKENIGVKPGLVAGAALLLDYILTVAVSASAGVAAIVSAFPSLSKDKLLIALCLIAVLTILNLRGISESSKIFSIPTYLFIFSMLFMIGYGLIKYALHGPSAPMISAQIKATGEISIFLILRAFSSGCSALTGLEAVSNSVPNFKEPSQKNASTVMMLLTGVIFLIFGGTSLLARFYHAVPMDNPTVVAQIAYGVFGKTFMFYVIQITTAIILIMACNTAFTGFPMLLHVIGKDGFAPRYFTVKGKRLSYSNGIIALAIVAGILVAIFGADDHKLIPLYSVGVFLSFTLAQAGMVIHWNKSNEPGSAKGKVINGFGTIITFITTIVIVLEKFLLGAWVVVLLLPIIVLAMMSTKAHYTRVANGLRVTNEEMKKVDLMKKFTHLIIVPVASINKATLYTLQYARSLSPDVIALSVSPDKEYMEKLKARWSELDTDILLVTKYSPYREIVSPLMQYIGAIAKSAGPDEKITVVLSQFMTDERGDALLHNHTSFLLKEALLKYNNLVVATFPYHLKYGDKLKQ